MAAKAGFSLVEERIIQLKKEVEELRETDERLSNHELCCQKAKEWFIYKNSESKADQEVEESSCIDLPNECQRDLQFNEILGLLSEIEKEEKRLLMLKHQLHSAQKQQEVGILNDILLKQSSTSLFHSTQCHPTQSHDSSQTPLAMWFAEIVQSIKTTLTEPKAEKFSETSNLFYNVNYSDGSGQSQDLLVEKIYKKKFKRDQRKKDILEELQFSTCHKGYCVQIRISRHIDSGHSEFIKTLDRSTYHIHFDIHLSNIKERLMEHLMSKKSVEEFVRQYVWKEIECLPT